MVNNSLEGTIVTLQCHAKYTRPDKATQFGLALVDWHPHWTQLFERSNSVLFSQQNFATIYKIWPHGCPPNYISTTNVCLALVFHVHHQA